MKIINSMRIKRRNNLINNNNNNVLHVFLWLTTIALYVNGSNTHNDVLRNHRITSSSSSTNRLTPASANNDESNNIPQEQQQQHDSTLLSSTNTNNNNINRLVRVFSPNEWFLQPDFHHRHRIFSKPETTDEEFDEDMILLSSSASAPWKKRGDAAAQQGDTTEHADQEMADTIMQAGKSMANQFLMRSPRGNRQYDVPQIECPPAEDGMERFACPTPDRMGRYRCIDDHVLCDGFIDCPNGEDEDRQACMFYKTTKAHLDVLADALLRWARGR